MKASVATGTALALYAALGGSPVACAAERSATREAAIAILREALDADDVVIRTLAAESLIWHGYTEAVRRRLEPAARTETRPQVRVALWRVQAQAQGNDRAAAQVWIGRIAQVAFDAAAPDRESALEALAVLRYGDRSETLRRLASEERGPVSVLAHWNLAAAGDARAEAALREMLGASEAAIRRTAARALRQLPRLGPETLAELRRRWEAPSVEPGERATLLAALVAHAPGSADAAVRAEALRGADEAGQCELALALAAQGDARDLPSLEAALSGDGMTRVAAAHAVARILRRQIRALSWADWVALAAYAALMVGIGWVSSRQTRTTEDYLLGGRRLGSLSVGLSLFATLISTISYLATPGEIIKHGPVFLAYIGALPLVYLITGYLLIPHIMRLPVSSAYEILEGRLGLTGRLTGAITFLLMRLVWMALIIFTSSRALAVMLGWPPERAVHLGVATGLLTMLYTSSGGLRGSVLTGALQTLVLFAGAVISVVFITWKVGGVDAWWPRQWAPNWDVQPLFSFDPRVRATVAGMIVTTLAWWVCTAGSDQLAIQRYLSTRDARAARRAFLINNVSDLATATVLAMLGFALLAFFRLHPDLAADGQDVVWDADYLFPHFIVNVLPAGIGGLVLAGLLAAAMSSLSAGFNSCCSVVTVDLLDRFGRRPLSGGRHLARTKAISTVIGLVVIGLSVPMAWVSGNIVELTNKTTNLFVAPLFVLFFMAMFVPFATAFGTVWGAVYGLAAGVLLGYWDAITGGPPLSWQWIVPVSMLVGVVAGPLWSLAPTRGRSGPVVGAWTVLAAGPLVVVGWLVAR